MDVVEDAVRIVDELQERGIGLRIMGAIGYRLHCPKHLDLFERLDRPITDMDFAGSARDATKILDYFESIGHKLIYGLTGERKIFRRPDGTNIDIFLDKLVMCHTIDFEKRLSVDYPTVPLAELALEKLQIVRINEKDIKDLCVMLLEHEVGDGDRELVNGTYIARLLGKDWGFYYTTMTNLETLNERLGQFDVVTAPEAEIITERANRLGKMIKREPKTMAWKIRAATGTRTKWYRDVEDFRS